jgi:hypothetical protein
MYAVNAEGLISGLVRACERCVMAMDGPRQGAINTERMASEHWDGRSRVVFASSAELRHCRLRYHTQPLPRIARVVQRTCHVSTSQSPNLANAVKSSVLNWCMC